MWKPWGEWGRAVVMFPWFVQGWCSFPVGRNVCYYVLLDYNAFETHETVWVCVCVSVFTGRKVVAWVHRELFLSFPPPSRLSVWIGLSDSTAVPRTHIHLIPSLSLSLTVSGHSVSSGPLCFRGGGWNIWFPEQWKLNQEMDPRCWKKERTLVRLSSRDPRTLKRTWRRSGT